MLNEEQIQQYLDRIDYRGEVNNSLATLHALHQKHLMHIPFENLDIFLGKPINLSTTALFDKLILRGRGGFCYELNGLFFALLSAMDFSPTMLSARVFNGSSYGRAHDHMLLEVTTQGRQVIVDVGFGDSFRIPLVLHGEWLQQFGTTYSIEQEDSEFTLYQANENALRIPQYIFSLNPYRMLDFEEMCLYQQTSPESHFTQKSICSIATPKGRKTISNGRLLVTNGSTRSERKIAGESEYRAILQKDFHISLPVDIDMTRLINFI